MTYNSLPADRSGCRIKWPWLCGLLMLALARAAWATDPLYYNNSVLNYTVPGNPPPTIDATNFDNESIFSVVFNTLTVNTAFYEPWNVVNYINNGTMTVNTGFQFDTQTTNVVSHQMAGSFYNGGTVSCGVITDTNLIFFLGAGELIVSATNIANPGEFDIGPNGFLQLTGGIVDLSRTTITMEGLNIFGNLANAVGVDWGTGTDTNAEWVPDTKLTPTSALSSLYSTQFSPNLVNYLQLTNSTPYFQVDGGGTSNVIVRAVFFSDQSVNLTHKVYFAATTNLGSGFATVEWDGPYINSSTGQTLTNYLYLNDDYVAGSATNVPVINGVPDNFVFTQSGTPFVIGPTNASGYPAGIFQPPGVTVTNSYSYVDAQLISSTTATNPSLSNPSGALTNLPGRIQINASGELDLTLAQISGPNYLSLTATNQFDGSAGADIVAPYSDISLGATNGFLIASNVLQSAIPNWSGTIQAWSTRWIFVTTNGITNDFRVLLVDSKLSPATLSQVQHLTLHGTNSVVISDVFNVMSTLLIDAQNLTLTTNGVGNGSTSPDGELNLLNNNIFWLNSLPNLLWLTNNGAIRIGNSANFGNGIPTYVTNRIASAPALAATGMLSELTGTNVTPNSTVTMGTNQYVFAGKLTNTVPNQILIASKFDGTMSNLIAAVNHQTGSGTTYSTNTPVNPLVAAALMTNHAFAVTARSAGSAGNSIVTATTSTNLTWNGSATLSGGADAVIGSTNVVMVTSGYYGAFINNSLLSDQGSIIYADNFVSGGTISNGIGSFNLHSMTAALGGSVIAGGDVAITSGSLVTSNLLLSAGRSLMLQVTNLLTDGGAVNPNPWSVGSAGLVGLNMPLKPLSGDLLGTTIACSAPGPNKQVNNTWAGQDYGVSTAGYTNNEAIGVLSLDALGTSSVFKFNGIPGTNSALYVDKLVLLDNATNFNGTQVNALNINTNLVIYYAQAIVNGASVAEKLNHLNNNHLRWVAAYAGLFSSTNIVYPDGSTHTFNAALAQSQDIDSNGNGIVNAYDPTPFFVSSQVNFRLTLTNAPPLLALLSWQSVTGATNYVAYATNLTPAVWINLTNFISAGSSASTVDPNPVASSVPRFYQVWINQNSTQLYGP